VLLDREETGIEETNNNNNTNIDKNNNKNGPSSGTRTTETR